MDTHNYNRDREKRRKDIEKADRWTENIPKNIFTIPRKSFPRFEPHLRFNNNINNERFTWVYKIDRHKDRESEKRGTDIEKTDRRTESTPKIW